MSYLLILADVRERERIIFCVGKIWIEWEVEQQIKIYIYIYIYKIKDLMLESMRLCHVGAFLEVARREDHLQVVANIACQIGSPGVIVVAADVSKVEDCE